MKTAKNLDHYCPVCGELLSPVAYRMASSLRETQQDKNEMALKKRVVEKERSFYCKKCQKDIHLPLFIHK
ncbi:MAG: hypothetical protein IJV35_05070 [Neisseriaceae bacterium]|nr:hypothetical protein [Neisseriaceae bacterium]